MVHETSWSMVDDNSPAFILEQNQEQLPISAGYPFWLIYPTTTHLAPRRLLTSTTPPHLDSSPRDSSPRLALCKCTGVPLRFIALRAS
jgi:hypothetical protein